MLERIWFRFGLSIALTVAITIGILWATIFTYTQIEYQRFYDGLPANVRLEMDRLVDQDMEDSPRMIEIYSQYWRGDPWDGEQLALLVGLIICLPFGLIAGLWISRLITLPVGSVAESAKRIALGDFSVRAHAPNTSGEMGTLIKDFNHMADSLETLEHERKATAAALSHELRTPLAVLQARLHALCDGVIAGSPQEFRKLLEQAEHLSRLVDDLHTLSVADVGKLSLRLDAVDLVSLARDVLNKYASRLAEAGMQASLQSAVPSLPVRADEDRLRQVLNNLIENAVRYAKSGGILEVDLRVDGAEAALTLADAGPGLPESIRSQLFKRFHRAEASRNRDSGGTGLGLAIVHTLITRQGGRITVDRSARGGAQFTLFLPKADS
jgi:signal transduction histidine kinase